MSIYRTYFWVLWRNQFDRRDLFWAGFGATGEPFSAKSDQFWVDIFKPKWNLSYIDGARLRDSEHFGCRFPPYLGLSRQTSPLPVTSRSIRKPWVVCAIKNPTAPSEAQNKHPHSQLRKARHSATIFPSLLTARCRFQNTTYEPKTAGVEQKTRGKKGFFFNTGSSAQVPPP